MADLLEERHIIRLFTRMTHLYAFKWIRTYGPAMTDDGQALSAAAAQWLYDLRLEGITPDEAAYALHQITLRKPEWPPGPVEFCALAQGVPTLVEVLDREHDHGPLCAAIRAKLDWYNLEQLPARALRESVDFAMQRLMLKLKKDGTVAELRQMHQYAIASKREALAPTGGEPPLVS